MWKAREDLMRTSSSMREPETERSSRARLMRGWCCLVVTRGVADR